MYPPSLPDTLFLTASSYRPSNKSSWRAMSIFNDDFVLYLINSLCMVNFTFSLSVSPLALFTSSSYSSRFYLKDQQPTSLVINLRNFSIYECVWWKSSSKSTLQLLLVNCKIIISCFFKPNHSLGKC